MNNRDYRKKNGVKELDKCYLCNNKAQTICLGCGLKICNDCKEKNKKCYKCNCEDS